MYKLLVADDEMIIRRGIVNQIRREQADDFEVYEAKNGEEAVRLAAEEKVDALILDIKMPKLDGIGVLKELQKRGIRVPSAILSGYNEFDYAQQALGYGVLKYILKPVVPDKISEITNLLKEFLDRRSRETEELERLRVEYRKARSRQKEKFFFDLLNSELSEREIGEQSRLLEISFDEPYYQIAVLGVRKYNPVSENQENYLTEYSVSLYLENTLKGYRDKEYFQIHSSRYVILFKLKRKEDERVVDWLEELRHTLEEHFHVRMAVGIGCAVEGIGNLQQSYYTAEDIVRYLNIQKMDHIVTYEDVHEEQGWEETTFDMERISIALKSGLAETAVKAVKELFSVERSGKEEWYILMDQIVLTIYQTVFQVCGRVEEMGTSELVCMNMLYKMDSLQEIESYIIGLLEKAGDTIQRARAEGRNSMVQKIEGIVSAEYNKPLSMKYIADRLFLNHVYLGQLYKKERGISLSDYINEVRIARAKKLLRSTDDMIYVIAEQVGFVDSQYFSTVFKKVTGVSPREYREM